MPLSDYLALIPPEHTGKPKFRAMAEAVFGALVEIQDLIASIPEAFDVDEAVGVQLDTVGLWVGVTRRLSVPLPPTWLTWGTEGLGWGQGRWLNPFDATTGIVVLDDDTFRAVIRARIAANHWDGSLQGMQDAYDYVFRDPNSHIFVQDNQDLTITLNVSGNALPSLLTAILLSTDLPLVPAGVQIAHVNVSSVGGTPLFGFGLNNEQVAGWGIGSWATPP